MKKINDEVFADRQRKIVSIRETAVHRIREAMSERAPVEQRRLEASQIRQAANEQLDRFEILWADSEYLNEAHEFMLAGEIDLTRSSMKTAMQ